jgi:A/G-specific adenine glycosylase
VINELKKWFSIHKRDLPWRENPSPYRVWVSEIMLQQTQASVVIPYFERWMTRFPTVESLASAPIEEVIKLWEGLGYYARARNLHQGARYVVEKHQGIIPNTAEQLAPIKGLGDYTIGALLSFAFHQRAAAVDGNVIRVLSRYLAIEEDVAKQPTLRKIRAEAQKMLPVEEPWIIVEALIELGATICQKKPKCSECPIRKGCQGFVKGIAQNLPYKSTKSETIALYRLVPIIEHEGCILIRKVGEGEIMSDLHEFPYL